MAAGGRTAHGRRAWFTLIELMVVIVIMALVLAITIPTFHSLMSGSRVQTAVRELGLQVQSARHQAIATARHVALIMPGPATPGVPEEKLYTCHRLAYVTYDGTRFQFDGWLENSQWEYLPSGTTIMEADGDLGIQDSTDFQKLPQDDRYSKVNNVDLVSLGGGSTVDDVRALIFAPGGKVKGDTQFLTVGEASRVGGMWVIVRPDERPKNRSCSDQVTLQVNRFTGNVTFLRPEEY